MLLEIAEELIARQPPEAQSIVRPIIDAATCIRLAADQREGALLFPSVRRDPDALRVGSAISSL